MNQMTAHIATQIDKMDPRHRRPAGPPRLRAGAVCLSGQPFPQPCARQHLDGGAGRRRALPHHVLAISAGRDRVLYRGARFTAVSGSGRCTSAGSFSWKAIEPLQLVLGLSIPALVVAHIVGARLGQALFGHEKLYPQELYAFWVAQPVQDLADVARAGHRLGPWQHRALFLAADESVFQARRAVPARGRGAGSDAGAARLLSGRTERRRRQRQTPEWRADNLSAATGRHRGRAGHAGRHHRLFPDRLSRPARTGAAGARRARAERAPRRHDHPVLRQRPDDPGAEGPQRAGGEPAQQRRRMPASAAAAPAARPAASA